MKKIIHFLKKINFKQIFASLVDLYLLLFVLSSLYLIIQSDTKIEIIRYVIGVVLGTIIAIAMEINQKRK